MKKNEIIPYNPKLIILARELRNNSTKSEIIIWNKIKKNIPPTPFKGGGRGEPASATCFATSFAKAMDVKESFAGRRRLRLTKRSRTLTLGAK